MKKHLNSFSIYNEMRTESSLSKKIDWKFVQYVYDVLLEYIDKGMPFSLDMQTSEDTLLFQNFKIIDDEVPSYYIDSLDKNGPVWEITLDFGHVKKYYKKDYNRDYKKYKLLFESILKRIQKKYKIEIVGEFEATPYENVKYGLDYGILFKVIK